ncbi:uncharacterized protein [Dendrobates tinctorius]|uniref:uncharacterized protein n=1 Tax=Dendrobates tinctorius TaxID=92724 RepID=UPI003CCA1F21
MDQKAREKAWINKLNEVFGGDQGVAVSSRETEDLTARLKNLCNKKTRIWWNKSFLERYVDKGLIPRGLRVQVFPSFSISDEIFRQKWEEVSSVCSKGYMELLIKSNEKTLSELEDEINHIQLELREKMHAQSLAKFNTELEEDFTKWEQDIVSSKTKKYQRDVNDFANNRAYRWRRIQGEFRSTRKTHHNSFSSASSVDEEVASNSSLLPFVGERLGTNKFGQKRGKTQTKRKMTPPQSKEKKSKGHLEVINLSDHKLTQPQLDVLSKGLTFVPSNKFNYFVAMKDLQLFLRKVVLCKLHFKPEDTDANLLTQEQEAINIREELETGMPPSSTGLYSSTCFNIVLRLFTSGSEELQEIDGRRTHNSGAN